MEEERHRYIVEWFDPTVKVKREFLLTYFPSDNSVEMFDRQLKKLFLKKIKCENLDPADVYVGSVINVFSRQLFITDYGDPKTREKFTRDSELTVGFIKDSGFQYMGRILDSIYSNGITVSKGVMIEGERSKICRSSFFSELSSKFVVLELRGTNAVEVWKKTIGLEATLQTAVAAELGSLGPHCLAPLTQQSVKTELEIFFPAAKDLHCNTAVLRNSTCCIVKPHAVREGLAGKIIQDIIDGGFEISALEYVNFDLPAATEFYEVYKGVVSYYQEMVAQLISGPCVALEITHKCAGGIVERFREFAGPIDAGIAKKLRPKTLRAKYGKDNIKNAVHCTDLPEDGQLEVEYLFRILAIP